MSSAPDIDPYVVLGVAKEAALPEIKAAHRKLVLKCHPDKIQDESMRSQAQDLFQKVQQAYELLSDETRRTKYDQKVRLAELRREVNKERGASYSSTRASGSASREYRDGRIYEERAPADAGFFDDEMRFTDEPRSTTRKHDDFGTTRPRSKGADDKKKSKGVPAGAFRAAKESARESAKTSHSNRAKSRTKERRRDAYEKYEHTTPYVDSDSGASDSSSASSVRYVRVKRPSERRSYESSSRKPQPTESSSRRHESRRHDDEAYSDEWSSKHDLLHNTAQDYILRSKGTVPVDGDRRHRSSRSPLRHRPAPPPEAPEPEAATSRRSGRSTRSRENVRPSESRSSSYEHLEQTRAYETKAPPSMPTAATSSPRVKVSASTRPPQPTRSATVGGYSRSKREGSGRSDPVLLNMVYPDGTSRSSKLRPERYDSGYSSPGTPEMPAGASPPKTSTRYKIVTEPDTVLIEPDLPPPSRHQKAYSPPRQEQRPPPSTRTAAVPPPPQKLSRSSTTYAYTPDPSTRYESTRSSRHPSTKPLFGEFRPKEKDPKYAREYGPDYGREPSSRHHYEEPRVPTGRRQSAYA
ncbi:hypothetical protein ASPWEDRAFT_26071 [Aspergillus wentii DTO 134E9]|uniref:J domain-containing protein n=1 Tax=Aspergillus wentii DTO 134E9 TaxID=1073089 RepID=A0A1L9RP15_ASPWE|nr:uncharacterized protein ASPWEDRAFT_26071 [Aspergillus wentii DTO 134E9]KAI9934247.1 hypothetical protein MW887_005321 [Aspergillus wentii]OJJ36613.1 hypothetical protein ASPWEDRAFT_26071 [Aspergillus wentii DTO 134E9]